MPSQKNFKYQHFYTTTSGREPSSSSLYDGELAVNIASGGERIFLKNTDSNVITFIPEHEINSKISSAVTNNNLFYSASYNSQDHYIYFYNTTGSVVGSINAADFIVDGMVENVVLSGSSLVISFNTDAGKQDIVVDLSQIFDPSNYYTKSEVNGILNDISDDVNTISGAVQSVSGDVYSLGNTVSSLSGDVQSLVYSASNWTYAYDAVIASGGSWSYAYDTLTSSGSSWNSVYDAVSFSSSCWNYACDAVSSSAYNWNYACDAVSSSAYNWNSAYDYVSSSASTWNSYGLDISSLSGDVSNLMSSASTWNSAANELSLSGSYWDSSSDRVSLYANNWDFAYNAITTSGNSWNSAYDSIQSSGTAWNNIAYYGVTSATVSIDSSGQYDLVLHKGGAQDETVDMRIVEDGSTGILFNDGYSSGTVILSAGTF